MCKISEMNLETAKYYGYEAQSNQLVEECAELIQAVNKYRRVETGLGQPVAEDKKAIARDNLVIVPEKEWKAVNKNIFQKLSKFSSY